ncbi:MAG: E3 ubiquitin-protein ligase hrd1 [Claussenomyces sp. TS43310]|nr:MAG: E3 ubiquitin-protein ligase hrd1 [Claussenomyces sp. TS43310]
MRLAAYAGASVASAAAVVIYAFNQRSNFYSACVYLSQSNLCLMILTNLILFIIASLMYSLQRLFFGPLRPIEIEQLYEKGWFAVTETCLAMTIFREEVGAWFLIMFVALLVGKVWGWIGEGRVEILEQQPPTNPRLFHLRLSFSLGLSLTYDLWLLIYTINTVIQQARPNMMVMFLFEFAVLTTSSTSTALRYGISLVEANVIKKQTKERLEVRRRELRAQREEILRQRAAAAASGSEVSTDQDPAELPSEDDVNEIDIEVPGWEAKGQWILSLDLATDLFKLGIYTAFFFILMAFYGLPIHIMRDLFLTARSFVKRLTAFIKYRRATQDMARYPDATVEEISREDTCIICREEMTPWSVTNPVAPVGAADGAVPAPAARTADTVNERTRPKKLPCGHVLHLGCLKSWLERQQVCPTCRRPVVDTTRASQADRPGHGAPGPQGQQQLPGPGAQPNHPQQDRNENQGNMRVVGIGPLRFAFGQANMNEVAQALGRQEPARQDDDAGRPRMYGLELGFGRRRTPQNTTIPANVASLPLSTQLQNIEQQIMREINDLQASQQELQIVQLLQQELARLRQMHDGAPTSGTIPQIPQMPFPSISPLTMNPAALPSLQRHGSVPGVSAIPSGSSDLPPGVTLPEGWSLLPLQRLDGPVNNPPSSSSTLGNATSTVSREHQAEPSASHLAPTWDAPISTNPPPPPVVSRSPHESMTTELLVSSEPTAPGNFAGATQPANPTPVAESVPTAAESVGATSSSSGLPNWNTFQAYTTPGLVAGDGNSNGTQVPSVAEAPASTLPTSARVVSPAAAEEEQASSSSVSSRNGSDGRASEREEAAGTDKGKAKARSATVEDDGEDA